MLIYTFDFSLHRKSPKQAFTLNSLIDQEYSTLKSKNNLRNKFLKKYIFKIFLINILPKLKDFLFFTCSSFKAYNITDLKLYKIKSNIIRPKNNTKKFIIKISYKNEIYNNEDTFDIICTVHEFIINQKPIGKKFKEELNNNLLISLTNTNESIRNIARKLLDI